MGKKQFKDALEILSILERNGHEAYIVGGSVRDYLLGRPVRDIDIATSAAPERVKQLFNKVIPVGIEFGTVIVRFKGTSFEVTTFQASTSTRNELVTIEEDLRRRDFTINALAMNKAGEIIDLFSGKQDLKNRTIRAVESAEMRFEEDPLRVLRALRFVSQLNFSIEQTTLEAMKKLKHLLNQIAIERITHECTLLFQGKYVQKAINYLIETGVEQYLPVFNEHYSLQNLLHASFTGFQSFAEVIAYFCFKEPTISTSTWMKRWKCSRQTKYDADNLLEAIREYEENGMNHWLLYRLKEENIVAFVHLLELLFAEDSYDRMTLLKQKKKLPIQSKRDLHINGNEVIQLFPNRKSGSWIETYLTYVEKEVVMGRLENEKQRIKEWILCHPLEKN